MSPDPQAFETSVRQMIANGKSRTALESAKQHHKSRNTAASEALLLDAYEARIRSLLDQKMTTEAVSLTNLVKERFPAAGGRFDALKSAGAARSGDLASVLAPLAVPDPDKAARTAVEEIVATQLTDLASIASCATLPLEHPLRLAAGALDRAFRAVTSGPVTEEQIALPEVSHRSPLAGWKLLIRAIAAFHKGEDADCRSFLEAIRPETVPARAIPALRVMLGDPSPAPLKPAESALVSKAVAEPNSLRDALAKLDREFDRDADPGATFKAVKAAVRECQRSLPQRVARLKQLISGRAATNDLDPERLDVALEGAPRADAAYFRTIACAMESTREEEGMAPACGAWARFLEEAVREGWFAFGGVEEATLYLHQADLLSSVDEELLIETRRQGDPQELYFLYPEELYARACRIDPHTEAFAQWLRNAKEKSQASAAKVAEAWSKALPNDIEPLLYLMDQAEKRKSFPKALGFLERAERIDAVNTSVRAARLRLLVAGALRQLEQRKPHLAAKRLEEIEALPQAKQGDRPAFCAALRYLILAASYDDPGAEQARREAASLLGSPLAASVLIWCLARAAKRLELEDRVRLKGLPKEARTVAPAAVANAIGTAFDMGIADPHVPFRQLLDAEAQLRRAAESLSIEQLRTLGRVALANDRLRFAWEVSAEGLRRGGPAEAAFLLLRADATPGGHTERYMVLTAAAVDLGRLHNDTETVERAVEILRNPYGGDPISLTREQALRVVKTERNSPAFPADGRRAPDYSDLLPRRLCQCQDCRRSRGEEILDDEPDLFDPPFDEAEMERFFLEKAPPDMPPEVGRALFEIMKDAFLRGEDPEETVERIMGPLRKKRERK